MVRPSSDSGRSTSSRCSGRDSLVGSRTVVIADLLRRADTTFRRWNPATEGHREQAGRPAGVHHVDAARPELADRVAANASGGLRRCRRRLDQVVGVQLEMGVQFGEEPGPIPAGVAVPGHVFGADHEQGLHHRHLRGEVGLEIVGEVLCERLRRAGELIDEDLRPPPHQTVTVDWSASKPRLSASEFHGEPTSSSANADRSCEGCRAPSGRHLRACLRRRCARRAARPGRSWHWPGCPGRARCRRSSCRSLGRSAR